MTNPTKNPDFESVTTENINNVEVADKGEIQSKINTVHNNLSGDERGKIILKPDQIYDSEGSEVHVKDHITLDFNGAIVKPQSDHNAFFLDLASRVEDATVDVTDVTTYTSDVFLVDTSRATTNLDQQEYVSGRNQAFELEATVHGEDETTDGSAALRMVSDGNTNGSGAISQGCRIYLNSSGCQFGVVGQIDNGGFINFDNAFVQMQGHDVAIQHENNNGSAGRFDTTFRGTIQNSNGTAGIRNQTSGVESVNFNGFFADPHRPTNSVVGPNISLLGQVKDMGTGGIEGTTDQASNQQSVAVKDSAIEVLDLSAGTNTAVSGEKVDTPSALVGGGNIFERVDRREPSSDTSEIQFTGLSENVEYRIFLAAGMGIGSAPSSFRLRLNDDGSSTGNYDYWDETGTFQSGENEFLIGEFSNNTTHSAILNISSQNLAASKRTAINQRALPQFTDRLNTFAREGARTTAEAISSIELIADESFSGGDTLAELWKRDYS